MAVLPAYLLILNMPHLMPHFLLSNVCNNVVPSNMTLHYLKILEYFVIS